MDGRGHGQDLNLLVQDPHQRIGRRGVLRVGHCWARPPWPAGWLVARLVTWAAGPRDGPAPPRRRRLRRRGPWGVLGAGNDC